MHIVICGAGTIGRTAAECLNREGHAVTLVDTSLEALEQIKDAQEVNIVHGNCADASILTKAGIKSADALISATNSDETNLLTASIAAFIGEPRTIARVHLESFVRNPVIDYAQIFSVDCMICPELATAKEIASQLRNPGAIAIEHFADHSVEMQQFIIRETSPAIGKNLKELKLPSGSRIAAIRRGEITILPTGETIIEPRDELLLVADNGTLDEARALLHQERKGKSTIAILGGTSQSLSLCKVLSGRQIQIKLFVENKQKAQEIAENIDDEITVIAADPTDPLIFNDEHLEDCHAFVALVQDERNLLSCAWAKRQGIKEAYPLITKDKYLSLAKTMEINKYFCPQDLASREMLDLLDNSRVHRLASLADDAIDVFKIRVDEKAKVINIPLHQLSLTPDCSVVAIERDGKSGWVPNGNDLLKPNDTICVVAHPGMQKKLLKLFGGI